MKRIFTLLILVAFVYTANTQEVSKEYIENELIVWLKPEVDATEFARKASQGLKPKRVLSKRLNIWLFEFTGETIERGTKLNNLRLDSDTRFVQNNHLVKSRAITPNDEYYDTKQWAPAKIQLPDVWDDYTTGGTSADGDDIVIAVIDGGFDLSHEDLNFWKNNDEIPNNGIDDDDNGYIDDFDGWNAYNNSGNITSASHGTHVAGIAGAIGNNTDGISGVNWDVNILPIQGSSATEATVVAAYSYALEMRALYNETNGQSGAFIVVTNASFGVDRGNPANFPIWCAIYDALGSEGILNCAATANNNWNIDQVGDVPCSCSSDYLITVTNTTSSDVKYTNAGYGINTIDLGAPGTGIYSTLPGDTYGNSTGTSMACPQVSGVISLMYASMCQKMIHDYKSDPGNFALNIRQCLLNGADNIPSLSGLVAYGRLNALEAVENIYGNNSTISGPKTVCDEATYTIQNFDQLPEGVTVQWSVNNNILTLVSGQGTEACVFRKNEPGISLVQAEILLNSQVISTLSFLVSTEIKVSIVGNTNMLGCGKTRAWQCSMNCPSWDFGEPVRINWTLEGDGQRYYGSGPTFSIGTSCGRTTSLNGSRQPINTPHAIYTLRLEVTLPDGTTYSAPDERFEIFGYIEVFDFTLDKNLRIYPNPTTGETTLILEPSSAEKAFDATTEWYLEVYDNMQGLKLKKQKLKGKSTRINTQSWKEGVYMVRVKYKNEILTGKLIVKK